MSRADPPSSTVAALAALLSRHLCAASEPRDPDLAVGLVRQFGESDGELMIAAAAAMWTAFGNEPEDLPQTVWHTAAGIARDLDQDETTTEMTTFASAALAIFALAGRTSKPAHDLVKAGNMARRVEQHLLAAACARAALAREDELPRDRRVLARITLAVATRHLPDVEALYADAADLPPDDPIRAIADSLWASLHPDGRPGHIVTAGEAIMASDRRAAAVSMVSQIEELIAGYREDDLLRGLHQAFTTLAAPVLDIDRLLEALPFIIGHARDRQRFGELPQPARAGIDMLLSILTIQPGSDEAAAMIGLMDGLADSGLDQFLGTGDGGGTTTRGDIVSAEITQAGIASSTVRGYRWRNADTVMAALSGRTALLFRERRTRNAAGFTALHLRPPDGVSIKNRAYSTDAAATLAALVDLANGNLSDAAASADIDAFVGFLLPNRLQEEIREGLSQLAIVPDGDLWLVPWTASRLLENVDVRLIPSLPERLPPTPALTPVHSILAIVDKNAPGSKFVIDALQVAAARHTLKITYADDLPTAEHDADLLLFFGHGSGRGLAYGLHTPQGVRTALDVVHSRGFRQALLAACWSTGSPAPGSQISVPAALLASGITPVVGGTWPLPAIETALLTARLITHLEAGTTLASAVRHTLANADVSHSCGWGIAIFGT